MVGSRTTRTKRTVHESDEDEDELPNASSGSSRRVTQSRNAKSQSRLRAAQNDASQFIDLSSDDQDENDVPSSLEAAPRAPISPQKSKAKNTKAPANPKAPSQSPRKSKATSNKASATTNKPEKTNPTRTLHSFFNKATERQQSQGSVSPEKKVVVPTAAEEEDLIQDDSLDEDMAKEADTATFAVPMRKRKLDDDFTSSSSLIQGSQKFLKTSSGRTVPGSQVSASGRAQEDSPGPWVDRYGPTNVDELAVHKKKVSDVREWLATALEGKDRKRLLILKGGAGTGKTTTVKLLAEHLGAHIREWHNPASLEVSSEGFVSVASQFEEFIGSSGKFGALELFNPTEPARSPLPSSVPLPDGRQITLVEEFPNVFMRSGSSLTAFRSAIMQYLVANSPSMDTLFSRPHESVPGAPILMIISETLLNNSTASVDSFTAQRLLGAEILTHPGTSVIEFNPVAPTILTKALELVIRKEARDSGRRRAPGPAVLKHLSEIGDVRSAVSALEFLCLRGDEPNSWSGRVAATTKGRKGAGSDAATLTDMEKKSLEIITQRENALGIFHAVGKVIYNKREAPAATDTPPPQPPIYLSQHMRPKVSEVDVNTLLEELGTDIQTFIGTLHENYALSCSAPDSEQTAAAINGSIDALSDADLLSSDNLGASGLFRRAFRGTSGDTLRQEELSFQVAVRGLLFNLPHPVKRVPPPASFQTLHNRGPTAGQMFGGKGDAYRMFFPTSIKLWRRREEIEGILTMLLNKAQKGELRHVAGTHSSHPVVKPGSVESWRSSTPKFTTKANSVPKKASSQTTSNHEDVSNPSMLLMGGASAKREMLLEQLPYIALINKTSSTGALRSDLLRQIEQVTQFGGTLSQEDETSDEEDEAPEGVALGPRTMLAHRAKKKEEDFVASATATLKEGPGLVLSDDDIEDD